MAIKFCANCLVGGDWMLSCPGLFVLHDKERFIRNRNAATPTENLYKIPSTQQQETAKKLRKNSPVFDHGRIHDTIGFHGVFFTRGNTRNSRLVSARLVGKQTKLCNLCEYAGRPAGQKKTNHGCRFEESRQHTTVVGRK